MVRQGGLNQRHDTFTQKANAISKVQAYLTYCSPGCFVVEATINVALTALILMLIRICLRLGFKGIRGNKDSSII